MGKKSRIKKSRTTPKAPGAAPRPVGEEALAESWAIPLWVALVVLVVLPSILYFNSLSNPFLYDDSHSLVKNSHVRSLENIPSFFTSARTTSIHSDKGHYRPVLFSTYALSYALGGYDYDPKVFRLANLVLHTLNGLLVFAVFRRLSGKTALAFFAALLFAVHPLNAESVNYISCRSNVLATTFYLASVGLFVGYAGGASMRRRAAFYAGSLLCFVLGLLSKEIAVTLPVMLVLLDVLALSPWKGNVEVKKLVRRHAAFFVVTALYGGLLVGKMLVPSYEKRDVLSNLIIQTKAMAYYLKLLVFPRGLSISHGFDTEGLLNLAFSVSLLVIGASLFLAWKLRGRCGLLSFAILWYFITLLPTSSVIALYVPVNEHRVYLPGIGFAAAIGFAMNYGRRRLPLPAARFVAPLFLVVMAVFSIIVVARNRVWQTPDALWEDAARKYPHNAHAHEALANSYARQGYLEKAKREYELAVRYAGKEGVSLSLNLINLINEAGDYRGALKAYEERLRIEEEAGNRAGVALALTNIGIVHGNLGDFTKALEHFEKSLEIEQELGNKKTMSRLYTNIGATYGRLGDSAQAIRHFEKAVEMEPRTAEAYINLAHAYLQVPRVKEAEAVCEKMKNRGFHVPEDLRKRLEAAVENP